MIPVHFGRGDRPLFGAYSPAVEPRARRGVVICNPWGIEALRAHRALHHLSRLLSQNGLDVLRFDYSGTGDSFGNMSDARLADWIDDTGFAIEELLALAGIRQIAIVGLRLGSYVAAAAAARYPREVDRVVLWEPVFHGSDHLEKLRDGGAPSVHGDHGVAGFPLPPVFGKDLADVSLAGLPGPRIRVLMAHSSTPQHNGAERDLAAREVAVACVDSEPCWVEEREFGAGAVPVELLRTIAEWLK